MKKKKIVFPRVPLPRQTGGAHNPKKGGKYRRQTKKGEDRKEIRAELE